MKKVIKKGLSCLIAGLMAFSGISGALAANEAELPTPAMKTSLICLMIALLVQGLPSA